MRPTRPSRLPGLFQTVERGSQSANWRSGPSAHNFFMIGTGGWTMQGNSQNSSTWTFTGPVGPTGVLGPVLPSASIYWTKITNSTWPLKTQTVKIISRRSSLWMASGKISLLQSSWDLGPGLSNAFILTFSWFRFHLQYSEENWRELIGFQIFARHDILPIAMGAREEDYQRAAPYKSYLHVDQFEDPQQLAKFLHQLDQNDDLYNQYFQVLDKICRIS